MKGAVYALMVIVIGMEAYPVLQILRRVAHQEAFASCAEKLLIIVAITEGDGILHPKPILTA